MSLPDIYAIDRDAGALWTDAFIECGIKDCHNHIFDKKGDSVTFLSIDKVSRFRSRWLQRFTKDIVINSIHVCRFHANETLYERGMYTIKIRTRCIAMDCLKPFKDKCVLNRGLLLCKKHFEHEFRERMKIPAMVQIFHEVLEDMITNAEKTTKEHRFA